MFVSALVVSMPPPSAADVNDYLQTFGANALLIFNFTYRLNQLAPPVTRSSSSTPTANPSPSVPSSALSSSTPRRQQYAGPTS